MIGDHILNPDRPFRLKNAIILDIHKAALDGIHPQAGTYRNIGVTIGQSGHSPPRSSEVADHVNDMCSFINENWHDKSAIYLSSYVLWRLNWIHPFADGNGRTSRILSYVVLSIKLKSILPGVPTIPDQIADNKSPYYDELEKADASWKQGNIAITSMELWLETLLARQLYNATTEAGL